MIKILLWLKVGTEMCELKKSMFLYYEGNVLILNINSHSKKGIFLLRYRILLQPKYNFFDHKSMNMLMNLHSRIELFLIRRILSYLRRSGFDRIEYERVNDFTLQNRTFAFFRPV